MGNIDRKTLEWKIIRKPFLPEGIIEASTESEAIEKAIIEWKIPRDSIIGAERIMR